MIQLEDDMQSRNVIEARITVEQGQQEVLDEQLEMNTEKVGQGHGGRRPLAGLPRRLP